MCTVALSGFEKQLNDKLNYKKVSKIIIFLNIAFLF